MQCACGSPRFWNSITLAYPITFPKISSSFTTCINFLIFMLNTRQHRSGLSVAFCPGFNSRVISGHFGLHVIFRNTSGCQSFPDIV